MSYEEEGDVEEGSSDVSVVLLGGLDASFDVVVVVVLHVVDVPALVVLGDKLSEGPQTKLIFF